MDLEIFPVGPRPFTALPHQTLYYRNLTDRIRTASKSIRLCQYVLAVSPTRQWQRSNKILNDLIDASARGVDLRILYDRPKFRSPNLHSNVASFRILHKKGIAVRCLSLTKTLHIKLIIIDGDVFFAGSHNLTNQSLYSPFELSWECSDPFMVNAATIYFDALFNGSMSEPYSEAFRKMENGNRNKPTDSDGSR